MYKVINVELKIWAADEEEGARLQQAFTEFVNEHAAEGRRVTAEKLAAAIPRWKNNALVRGEIIRYFS